MRARMVPLATACLVVLVLGEVTAARAATDLTGRWHFDLEFYSHVTLCLDVVQSGTALTATPCNFPTAPAATGTLDPTARALDLKQPLFCTDGDTGPIGVLNSFELEATIAPDGASLTGQVTVSGYVCSAACACCDCWQVPDGVRGVRDGCGDGRLDPDSGEQCDDGNVTDGDCCSAACLREPNGSACDDQDRSTTDDSCSGGACHGVIPAAAEFAVNTFSYGNQAAPAIAANAAGDFVIVWHGRGQDEDGLGGIFGQRYSRTGAAFGATIKVNVSIPGEQTDPAVATGPAGDFVVVWTSRSPNRGVMGRRFDSTGRPLGSEFVVATGKINGVFCRAERPEIALLSNGEFVVVWGDLGPLCARRFDSQAVPLGAEFLVTPSGIGAAVASDASGNVIVVAATHDGEAIFARRYDSSAMPLGSVFQVNSTTETELEFAPAVATGEIGNFVVAWESMRDGSTHVFAQRFDPDAAPIETEFRVSSRRVLGPPGVAIGGSGEFLVVWPGAGEGFGSDVFGRRYAADGTPLGAELRISTTRADRFEPVVAADAVGRFVVAWVAEGFGPSNAVFGKRYEDLLEIDRPCPGDCNQDGQVTIAELVIGVNLALERRPMADCPQFDADGSGAVVVNELVRAVHAALNGCV